jgi:hypothetical protein
MHLNYCLRLEYCPTIIGHKKADLFLKNVVRLVSERSREFPRLVVEAEPSKAPFYTVILESAFLATFLLSLAFAIVFPPKGPLRGWDPPFELPDEIDRFVGQYCFSIAIISLILVFLVSPVLNRNGAFEVSLFETSEDEAIRARDGFQGGGRRRVIYDESIIKGRLVGKIWSRKGLLDVDNISQKGKVPAAWRVVESISDLLVEEKRLGARNIRKVETVTKVEGDRVADVTAKEGEETARGTETGEMTTDRVHQGTKSQPTPSVQAEAGARGGGGGKVMHDTASTQLIGRRLAIEELEEIEKQLKEEE